eukprot:276917-Pelagomonas_calceolata.AAC.2
MPSFRADDRLAGSGQEQPAKLVANVSAAPATASHAPLTLQPKFHGRGWAKRARAARCELYQKEANLGAHAP